MKQSLESLRGKKALITGGSSGIGAHLAATLAWAGVHVLLTGRREAELERVAERICRAGGQATVRCLDVTDTGSIAAMEGLLEPIDILVNNAGVVKEGAAVDMPEADWDLVVDTNLKGMFLMAQACARAMVKQEKAGSIINVASILGLRQASGVLSYAVSKAGVIQLTKTLALEWARFGIRVNAIAPGYLDTELNRDFWSTEAGAALVRRIPQRRLGRLEDLDGPTLLLASDAAAYMTGTVLAVDGGHLVSSL